FATRTIPPDVRVAGDFAVKPGRGNRKVLLLWLVLLIAVGVLSWLALPRHPGRTSPAAIPVKSTAPSANPVPPAALRYSSFRDHPLTVMRESAVHQWTEGDGK